MRLFWANTGIALGSDYANFRKTIDTKGKACYIYMAILVWNLTKRTLTRQNSP
jgi:hypothetical protein